MGEAAQASDMALVTCLARDGYTASMQARGAAPSSQSTVKIRLHSDAYAMTDTVSVRYVQGKAAR